MPAALLSPGPMHCVLAAILCIAASLCGPSSAPAAEFHVAPEGIPTNRGTVDSPWDIASTWAGQHPIPPGSTIHMAGGVYRHPDRSWDSPGFAIALQGRDGQLITIRPLRGERVTIDSKVEIKPQSHHICLQDLEITIAETAAWDRRVSAGGLAIDGTADLPQGGLNILGGSDSQFLNLVIHTMPSGVGFWRPAINATMSGCLIYDIGTIGPDRYHGPGIYTQNETGVKCIADNILFGIYSTTIQAYGSKNASVNGFKITGNIAFAPVKEGARQRFLIGGGKPSKDITVNQNTLFEIPLQIGYTAPFNEDAVVRDNLVVDADIGISNFRNVDRSGNLELQANEAANAARPADVRIRPLAHSPGRAHIAVCNWQRSPTVPIDLGSVLPIGADYRIVSAIDYFGEALISGQYDGGSIDLPVPSEPRTGKGSFCAFVLISSAATP